jgi:hypothetical protein
MKKFYSSRFIVVLMALTAGVGSVQAQTPGPVLFVAPADGTYAWTTGSKESHQLNAAGDSVYFLNVSDDLTSFPLASVSPSTTAVCAPAERRVQVDGIRLVLAANNINSLSILGNSSGTTSIRVLRAIFVNGVEVPAADYTTNSDVVGNPACGTITITGLNIAPQARVDIVFGSSTTSTPQNFRVNVIYVNEASLPVKFTGINAASVNGMTKVTWNIATELNTRSYIVEKSTDGVTFKNVAEVTATNASTYSWIDQAITPVGVVYYRVKAVDKDGKMGFSGVIKLSASLTKPGFVITPNVIPGRTMNLQLSNIARGNVSIRISNNMGQIVYTSSLINEGGAVSKTISLPGTLQAGTYRVQLVSGSSLMTQTAILQ